MKQAFDKMHLVQNDFYQEFKGVIWFNQVLINNNKLVKLWMVPNSSISDVLIAYTPHIMKQRFIIQKSAHGAFGHFGQLPTTQAQVWWNRILF